MQLPVLVLNSTSLNFRKLSGKGEVDVYRFMSKHSSGHLVLFFSHDLLSHFAISCKTLCKCCFSLAIIVV